MLTLGRHNYDLVSAPSGFYLELDPPTAFKPRQQWRLVAHYVPGVDNEPRAPDEEAPEYWVLTVEADRYAVSDWRALSGLGLEPEDDDGDPTTWYGAGELSCHLGPKSGGIGGPKCFNLVMGDMTVRRRSGYWFDCELTAFVTFEEGGNEQELVLRDSFPFAGVGMSLPINATPSAARARAWREIGPLEVAHAHVVPPDWRRKTRPEADLEEMQRIFLHTPCRKRGVSGPGAEA